MRPAYYTDPHLALYTGDAIDVLSELPDDSVHCGVTSPPYWPLRKYGTATWIGGTADCTRSARSSRVTVSAANRWETPADACAAVPSAKTANTGWKATAENYVDTLRAVFEQLRRVLVTTGTVWRNLGDSYSNAPPKRAGTAVHTDVLPAAPVTSLLKEPVRGANRIHILPRKNLWGMPWRVVFALQAAATTPELKQTPTTTLSPCNVSA